MSDNAILVLNCGSSSLKYAIVNADNSQPFHGLAEALGTAEARVIMKSDIAGKEKQTFELPNADHTAAIAKVFEELGDIKPLAVGHRLVHGGEDFTSAAVITDEVITAVEKNIPLAPLHNPANLQGVAAAQSIFPDLPQVAVFDTAFHQSMPAKAFRYGLPKELYTEHGIRRYGFHGTSHAYISSRADELVAGDNGWLTAHLGNGCSTAAVYAGKSLDTSMGLTPLEGVVMGTRSGDIDPGIYTHLHRSLGMSVDEIDTLLNKKSGLLGLTGGLSNDMRNIEAAAEEGNEDAKLALEVFAYRVAKSLASLSCALPTFTGIIFTGGIGENGSDARQTIVEHLAHFGITMDTAKNAELIRGAEGSFHADESKVQLWVIPTDEEGRIASETRALI